MEEQRLIQLTKHVSYLSCGENDRPNLGYISGTTGAVIVDSGNSKQHAELFMEQTKCKKDGKQCSLLLTHQHWDHISGAEYFSMPEYCSKEVYESILRMRQEKWTQDYVKRVHDERNMCDWTFENITNELETGDSLVFRLPDHVAEGKITFFLGEVTCYYEPVISSHSKGQYLVWIPEDKVVFIGDILWPNMEGIEKDWYYRISEFTKMKKQLLDYPADWYVESHAKPITRKQLIDWMDRMFFIFQKIQGGETRMEEILAQMPTALRQMELGYEEAIYEACINCRE